MAYADDDRAVFLGDFGGTVRGANGEETLGTLREVEVFKEDGQASVKEGTHTLRIATGTLTLAKQQIITHQETDADAARSFLVRDWVKRGAFTDLILVEA